ncbi:hypothetical protein GCM10018793_16940 [Streptomyces sulfonofaciens]|uniref:Uncharacterized protein n=1 Tax=Streptomyces sulfonofaciens TaxID=68272 RepID=A0A919FZP7_9ACTN|nr:hypothetical protein GCM10018793_16940 [Streptomyces sulfonofaciens]
MSLPGADELFRTTGGMALQASTPRRQTNGEPRVPPPAGESDEAAAADVQPRDGARQADAEHAEGVPDTGSTAAEGAERRPAEADQGGGVPRARGADPVDDEQSGARSRTADAPASAAGAQGRAADAPASVQGRKRGRTSGRRPSGRERHDEKITVYVSAEELMDLEHARLVLRGEHGLAVDRGRIVREAVAVVLADLESRGDASILVRRLRGR